MASLELMSSTDFSFCWGISSIAVRYDFSFSLAKFVIVDISLYISKTFLMIVLSFFFFLCCKLVISSIQNHLARSFCATVACMRTPPRDVQNNRNC